MTDEGLEARVHALEAQLDEMAGDKAAAQVAFKAAEPELVRSAQKGVLHKRTASRKVSRLAARVRAMA